MSNQLKHAFDLERFIEAQQSVYQQALAEFRAGDKRSHWSWFIFPQITGLGSSATSVRYAIQSLAEAQAYLAHPVLGPRLRECVATMNKHSGLSASRILGKIDAQKFRSCLTLFAQADTSEPLFAEALNKYFAGKPDDATLTILAGQREMRST
jgi:uncharacterized protein (DUF1810 family)